MQNLIDLFGGHSMVEVADPYPTDARLRREQPVTLVDLPMELHRHIDEHLAFGFGRHFWLGSHLARLEATTALNAFFDRLPNLRLDRAQDAQVVGLAFRSPNRLPVVFDT